MKGERMQVQILTNVSSSKSDTYSSTQDGPKDDTSLQGCHDPAPTLCQREMKATKSVACWMMEDEVVRLSKLKIISECCVGRPGQSHDFWRNKHPETLWILLRSGTINQVPSGTGGEMNFTSRMWRSREERGKKTREVQSLLALSADCSESSTWSSVNVAHRK